MKPIDFKSRWYKNCKRQRKAKARICKECPFREDIGRAEAVMEALVGIHNTANVKRFISINGKRVAVKGTMVEVDWIRRKARTHPTDIVAVVVKDPNYPKGKLVELPEDHARGSEYIEVHGGEKFVTYPPSSATA